MLLQTFLTSCGMNDKEIEIYQTLVRLGESGAQQVAQQTNRERTSTLRLMQSMVSRWRLGQTQHFHTSYFFAIPLETLQRQFSETLDTMLHIQENSSTLRQEYDQLQSSVHHDTSIKLYEGVSGIRVMYRTILDAIAMTWLIHIKCLHTATFESLSSEKKELSDEYQRFLRQLDERHVMIQSIAGKGMSLIEDLVSGFGIQSVEDMPWSAWWVQLWIVGQDLRFVITKKDPQVIHISSGPLANFFHALVEKIN